MRKNFRRAGERGSRGREGGVANLETAFNEAMRIYNPAGTGDRCPPLIGRTQRFIANLSYERAGYRSQGLIIHYLELMGGA